MISSALSSRLARLRASPAVVRRSAPSRDEPLAEEPLELTALYAETDGLELADGTRILPRGQIRRATAWLITEKELPWDADRFVIGEREDRLIAFDRDASGLRAGGGVVEAAADGLTMLERVALDVLDYLEDRAGLPGPRAKAPEIEAREAVQQRDEERLARALACSFYPGADREEAHAALSLGVLRAERGEEHLALEAFERSVAARVRAVRRGAEATEMRAAYRACAVAAEGAGASALSALCRERATR